MYQVQNHRSIVRSFQDYYEAAGYLQAYTACSGQTCVMYGNAGEVSLVAERERYGLVLVRTFGKPEEARDYMIETETARRDETHRRVCVADGLIEGA